MNRWVGVVLAGAYTVVLNRVVGLAFLTTYELYQSTPQSIVGSIHYDEWIVCNFKIAFLLSERILTQIKKASQVANWYEDPVVASTYIEQFNTCFVSIQQFHNVFSVLPQIGDRLYNEDTGLLVVGRSIDGKLMTVTFVLSL